MIQKIFTVFDTKAECFNTPFFMLNQGMAKRAFGDMANDERTVINKHPSDFMLYEIGEFDDNTGEVKSIKPVNLGHAPDLGLIEMNKLRSNGKEKVEVIE